MYFSYIKIQNIFLMYQLSGVEVHTHFILDDYLSWIIYLLSNFQNIRNANINGEV